MKDKLGGKCGMQSREKELRGLGWKPCRKKAGWKT